MTDAAVQDLYERMADEHRPGYLELVRWDPVRGLRGRRAVVRATTAGGESAPGQRFSMEMVPTASQHVGDLVLVRRLGRTPNGRWYPDGPAVYVSPVPSAVLAVALR